MIATSQVIVAAPSLGAIPYVEARFYDRSHRPTTQFVVLHATAGHSGPREDEKIADMFTRLDLRPKRSAHYVVDDDSVMQCVPETAMAYHCKGHGNARGIGVEFCAPGGPETQEQWLASMAMLSRGARLVYDICVRNALPLTFVAAHDLLAGARGITTHREVTMAWHESDHTDPGIGFPLENFLSAVRRAGQGAAIT